MGSDSSKAYLPAAGRDLFLPLYDPITRLLGLERTRRALLEQAGLAPGNRVLEIGCGTGTLMILAKKLHPDVEVVGIDPDPKALARAEAKAKRAGASIQLDRGFAGSLPYPNAGFDRVLSSMMFHHLDAGEKGKMLREVARVLRPAGRLEMLDFAGPRSGSLGLTRLIHSQARLEDNVADRVLARMRDGGLGQARLVREERAFFMWLAYYQASPSPPRISATPAIA